MKMKNNMMNKIIKAILLVILMSACRDDYSLDNLNDSPKLVVYCLPSPQQDTTFIDIARSIPVQDRKGRETEDGQIKGVKVTYLLNNEKYPVEYAADAGQYFVVSRHQPGDRVDIDVSAEGMPRTTASTVVPEAVSIALHRVVEIRDYDAYTYAISDYDQVQASFTDPAATADYYGLRVRIKYYDGFAEGGILTGDTDEKWFVDSYDEYCEMKLRHPELKWKWIITDSTYVYPEINTRSEPLLHPLTDLDEDFGYEADFYGGLYIFSDEGINGQEYTLRLNISTSERKGFMQKYQVMLYRLTPEYYRYLKSINDLGNNELAKIGFSQITPTYTNVRGGIGIVGGYNRSETQWKVRQ